MTEIDESFSGFDGAAKSYVQKLIPISDLFSLKKLNLWDMMFYGHMNT